MWSLVILFSALVLPDILRASGSCTDLHLAARNGDMSRVTELLKGDININAKDTHGLTALHYAAKHGHDHLIKV